MAGCLLEENLNKHTISLHHCPVRCNDNVVFAEVLRVIQFSTSMMKVNTKRPFLRSFLNFSFPLMNQCQWCHDQRSLELAGSEEAIP